MSNVPVVYISADLTRFGYRCDGSTQEKILQRRIPFCECYSLLLTLLLADLCLRDTSSYGRYERSIGPVADIQMISSLSINGTIYRPVVVVTLTDCVLSGKAEVVEFDENSLDQEPIPSDVFYTRREFDSHEGVTPVCFTFNLSIFALSSALYFSPLLLIRAHAFVNSSTTPILLTRCISVHAANDGSMKAAFLRMVISH